MIDKLPKSSKGGHVYLLVAVDKFTKWIEAMPVTNQSGHSAVKFFESIVFRFGVPHNIITDNGTNFAEGAFSRFCQEKHIRLDVTSVAHLASNGKVERSNGLVLSGIKPRLIEPLQRSA